MLLSATQRGLGLAAGPLRSACAAVARTLATKPPKGTTDPAILPRGEVGVAHKDEAPTITEQGSAFLGDLRSTSGLGLGDGIYDHTGKWLTGKGKTPMQYIKEAEPIKVSGTVVASYGSDDPALGCPVEYIDLRGSSREKPVVCKYTGNRFYSDDWRHAAH